MIRRRRGASLLLVHRARTGGHVRYRPVDEVAAEIEARAGSIWFNGDDNIWGADPDRAVALFDAIAAGKRRSWYGFGDLRSVQGPGGSAS